MKIQVITNTAQGTYDFLTGGAVAISLEYDAVVAKVEGNERKTIQIHPVHWLSIRVSTIYVWSNKMHCWWGVLVGHLHLLTFSHRGEDNNKPPLTNAPPNRPVRTLPNAIPTTRKSTKQADTAYFDAIRSEQIVRVHPPKDMVESRGMYKGLEGDMIVSIFSLRDNAIEMYRIKDNVCFKGEWDKLLSLWTIWEFRKEEATKSTVVLDFIDFSPFGSDVVFHLQPHD